MTEFDTVLDGVTFLEGPRWRDGALYVSDFYSGRYVRLRPGAAAEDVCMVDAQPSGSGWLPDGTNVLVSMKDQRVLRVAADGTTSTHADLSGLAHGVLNDMVVDASGRAYVGSFGFDLMGGAPFATAEVILVQPDGTARVVADELYFPNGSVITDAGRTLVVAETFGNCLTAFTIGADGSLTDRRVWAAFGERPQPGDATEMLGQLDVGADGTAIDSEGAIWVADALGQRVLRVREGGEILDEIHTGTGTYACGLGGDDGRTLYICVAPDFHEEARKAAPEARLITTRVSVPAAL